MTNKPTTTWYYDFYEPGTFPNQQKLCEKVMWTECNLEGQRLASATLLTGERANPLTIRLFGVKEALEELENEVNQATTVIAEQAKKHFQEGKLFGLGGQRVTSSSTAVRTGGAPVDRLEISGEKKPFEFSHIKAHLLLYELFANFGSILDRLAYEINLLYRLKIPYVDWAKLVNTKPPHDKNLKCLSSKDPQLGSFLLSYSSKLEKALRYRNRLMHDGIIRIDVDISYLGLKVLLAEDPNDSKSPMNLNAIDFVRKTKAEILVLLGESYGKILDYCLRHGAPPW